MRFDFFCSASALTLNPVSASVGAGLTAGVGAFFASSTGAAAGGLIPVMAGCAFGAFISSFFCGTGLLMAAGFFGCGTALDNPLLVGLSAIVATASIAGSYVLAASIAASAIGVSMMPVLSCMLIGLAICATATIACPLLAIACLIGGVTVCNELHHGRGY